MDLSVSESTLESWTVLEVRGEVDVHSSPELLKRLSKVLAGGAQHVIVDLDGLGFIDSTGLGTLVAARNQSVESDAVLRVVCSTERVLKLFRITGLHEVFAIYPSLADATTSD